MKWILIFIVFGFSACTKCGDCHRTWMYQEYEHDSIGTGFHKSGVLTPGPTEYFDICGADEILEHSGFNTIVTPSSKGYIEGYSFCTCITK